MMEMNTHKPSYLKELLCQVLVAWLWFKHGPVDCSRALLQHLPSLGKCESGPRAPLHQCIVLASPSSFFLFLGSYLCCWACQELEVTAAFGGLESMCRNCVIALWNMSWRGLAVWHRSAKSHHAQWVAVTYSYSASFGSVSVQGIIWSPEA